MFKSRLSIYAGLALCVLAGALQVSALPQAVNARDQVDQGHIAALIKERGDDGSDNGNDTSLGGYCSVGCDSPQLRSQLDCSGCGH
ncbi:hypothetical protein CBOM_03007 [Ceraceosorus bombacis]|uniref:Uncharacterized protein n=1 Tax=Ceraceosorus bombacis TaxID=401625 RepID=A0A0P1BLP6_9BASI|nr:hypothetical protein CBOM_03007 [Ceraceosorus bombacis]